MDKSHINQSINFIENCNIKQNNNKNKNNEKYKKNENNNNILFLINKLPSDIVSIIFDYIPFIKKRNLNRFLYKTNYSNIVPMYVKISFETYIRNIIINDYDFIFDSLIKNNVLRWIHIKKYRYKQIMFNNYIYFLQYFSMIHNSNKCFEILNNIIRNTGLDGKQHKNKINRNIIWIK